LLLDRDVNLLARFRDWFVSSADAPELLSSDLPTVDVILDEDDLFEEHAQSTIRLKTSGAATRAFKPSEELLALEDERDEEITRRIDVRELLAASGDDER
jgi:hypothetical protein